MELPLFPLRTVLFPGMPLPLQIFEERYRTMVRQLLADEGRFGVLLIRQGNEVGGGAIPYHVGTTAYVEEATELPNGRFHITARGEQRFRLKQLLAPRPYPYGEVELIDDSRWEPSPALDEALAAVRRRFPEYFGFALSLSGQWARPQTLPARPHQLVNTIAPWLQAEELTLFRLLEIEGAAERLAALAEVLDELVGRARRDATVRRRERFGTPGAMN